MKEVREDVWEADRVHSNGEDETAATDHAVKVDENDNEQDKNETKEQQEEGGYDPALNPNWRAAFRNRETIFDSRPRFRYPRKTLDEMGVVRDAWIQERHMISQTHMTLMGAYSPGYRGTTWVRKMRSSFGDMWIRKVEEKRMDWFVGELVRKQETDERAQEMAIWEAELPFWDGGGGDGGEGQQEADDRAAAAAHGDL